MLKKIMIASLAAGALAFNAPAALAEHIEFDCGFDTIAQEQVTGGQDTFTGVAYGYAVSPTPGDTVDIACYVRVDGTAATSTAGDGASVQADTFGAQVTYTASDTQDVDLCARVWVNGVIDSETCFETTAIQIPPQEVIDLIDQVFDLIAAVTEPLDAPTCALITALGTQGIVNPFYPTTGLYIDHGDCDVSLNGVRLVDFSPYMDAFGPPN